MACILYSVQQSDKYYQGKNICFVNITTLLGVKYNCAEAIALNPRWVGPTLQFIRQSLYLLKVVAIHVYSGQVNFLYAYEKKITGKNYFVHLFWKWLSVQIDGCTVMKKLQYKKREKFNYSLKIKKMFNNNITINNHGKMVTGS